ncbi:Peroxisomal membrane protein PAS20 [Cytospora mali]|uniref:Peroxisomal membrane protein PEX13 n=1 Tax=Cytospora mali TaxID=578113 RepID=A0A194V482_CYTMA|nr:Peroxisomal membrane protein PAS20 [Valsa mali var. pyri (nom. inval.)]
MASPPKPWEQTGASTTSTTSATSPAIPPRPESLTASVNQNAAAYSRMGTPGYGSYGGAYPSSYSSYGSPYSSLGGYGGMGGYGGGMYSSGYGGYRPMGYGGVYGGMGGMPDQNNPESLTHRVNQSTQATFQVLEGIVGAFGGFAQMLESTYMTTHSSFYAVVAVAEQFGNLRDTLGHVLGIYTIMRWMRTLIAKITGRPPPADAMALTPASFARFEGRNTPDGSPAPAKPSRKPLIFFLLFAFGLPYLMTKMIKSMAASHEEEERKRQQIQAQPIDPAKLEFCRVLWDFSPESRGEAVVKGVDLEVKKGDLVAVLSKTDPLGNQSDWWRCRSRDGRMGYLPSTFLEVARRPVAAIKATSSNDSSRANSLTSSFTSVMQKEPEMEKAPLPTSKPGDISAESFQKSQFYS